MSRTRFTLSLRRYLHIETAPTHSPRAAATGTVVPPQQSSPLYTTLGQPPTLLQVGLTPSLPTYIRRSSLISLSPIENVTATPYWLSPLKRMLFGFQSWRYHKLESTVPGSALVKSTNSKGLYVLGMDGKEDYAVFPRSAVLSYAGPALRVSTHLVPLKVQRTRKGKWFGEHKEMRNTGLIRSVGYTLLQGRGDAVLQGEGEVYKMILGEGEEVVVKRDSLVGLSITGELDCIEQWSLSKDTSTLQAIQEVPVEQGESTEVATVSQWAKYTTLFRHWLKIAKDYTTRAVQILIPSSPGYLKIVGPRTVLLQSGSGSSIVSTMSQLVRTGEKISITENKIQKEALKEHKPEDLLSYAVVRDGKVTFHSTPDFKDTVTKIEQAGQEQK